MFLNFNSIKVQLELVSVDTTHVSHRFQFHKGTIRTHRCASVPGSWVNFNSIKVQLELDISYLMPHRFAEFQFHKGTIRTSIFIDAEKNRLDFNSIKVQLEPGPSEFAFLPLRNFNSIKVQLEQLQTRSSASTWIFQFHKGTIRTPYSIMG